MAMNSRTETVTPTRRQLDSLVLTPHSSAPLSVPVFGYVTQDSLSVLDDIQMVKCKNKKPVVPVKM